MRHEHSLLTVGFGIAAAAATTCGASSCPTRNVITEVTWKCPPATWTNEGTSATWTYTPRPSPTPAFNWKEGADIDTGDIHCRYKRQTYEYVDETTCAILMNPGVGNQPYDPDMDLFYLLNPTMSPGCVGIRPLTEYCTEGFIEPLRAYDGRCGPPNRNATCDWMEMGPCCNSETWTCGDSEKDCASGVCYEGLCPGHKVFTTDGTCGYQNEHRRCAGKWGDCCSIYGVCGSGWDFCENDQCQSGNCYPPREHMRDCNAGRCTTYQHSFQDPFPDRFKDMPPLPPRRKSVKIRDFIDRTGYEPKPINYADHVVIEWVPIPGQPTAEEVPPATTMYRNVGM